MIRDFLSWCAQFRDFQYGSVSYWIDAYERGDGMDCYGHRIELSQGRSLRKRT